MKNTPKLRFKEFKDVWNSDKLGKYITIKSGFTPSEYNFNINGKFPFYKVEDLNNSEKYQINSRFYTNDSKGLIPKNSIIFPKRGAAILNNKVRICLENALIDTNLMSITPFDNSLDTEFLYYKIILVELFKIADTSTIPQINNKHIEPFIISFPTLPEQQKIASFLTAVDEKLQALQQKKTLLENYKKGLMQKIFSQELRFKDEKGKQFPDWEVKKLGDLASRIIQKNNENNQNVLTISAQHGLISQLEYFSKSVAGKILTGYYLLNKNDFAYNKSYSAGYPMGAIKRLKRYDKGIVSSLYICFGFNKSVDKDFMEQYFETGLHNSEIEQIAQEGARNHGLLNISVTDFFNINLKIPSYPEQCLIAKILSNFDSKLNITQTQIDQLQAWKKGLLQQMFV